jgi:hypothetical protein
MSILDTLREYKSRYDEMDPYQKEKLYMGIIGALITLFALYTILNSLDVVKRFFNR